MKKNGFPTILALVLICLAFNPFTANALFKSQAQEAQELIAKAADLAQKNLKAEADALYRQAEAKIIEALAKDQNDPEAYYASGLLFYHKGNITQADTRFNLACQQDSKMQSRIFDFYRDESKKAKVSGRLRDSIDLAVHSYRFNAEPARAKTAAGELFQTGTAYLHNCEFDKAKWFFNGAVKLDRSLMQKCAQEFIKGVKCNPSPQNFLEIYAHAMDYDRTFVVAEAEKIGLALKDKKASQEEVRPILQKFPTEIQAVIIKTAWPPDYIFLKRGEFKTFQLEPGECTPWIRSDYGVDQRFQRKYGEFRVCFRDTGKCYEPSKTPQHNTSDFKFCADTKADLRALIQ